MTDEAPNKPTALSQLGAAGVASIIWRYFKEKAVEQFKSVWFIVTYLLLFQIVILKVPITYGATITAGLVFVIIGLTFFMEGLRLGLMPFGETIGAILPRNSKLPTIMLFAFILGVGATLAEPAISVLKQAGSGVQPDQAPLLYSILNDFSTQLVVCVGIGVGLAVTLGILRFFFGWPLKVLIIPIVLLLASMTIFAYYNPVLKPIIGLAWDCGAVTTGPVTVPLVLALGIGVCRIIGDKDSGAAGFGIVTLASLFPIIAVLLLSFYHYSVKDYYGAESYKGDTASLVADKDEAKNAETVSDRDKEAELPFTKEEFEAYKATGKFPENVEGYTTTYQGGEMVMENGRIVHRNMEVVLEKEEVMGTIETFFVEQTRRPWNPDADMWKELVAASIQAVRAILPLCLFLFLTLLVVLRERLRRGDEIAIGIIFAVVGMALFGLGLTLGLTPLGTQLGSNVPVTFASITPWGLSGTLPPLFENAFLGKLVAILFAFFLGYGATLAEPALNALGQTVEDSTVGVFKKKLLMQVVAIGVGLGIATGVSQMAFASLELTWLLIPPYLVLLFLTVISSDEFVNFAWDSAGVTTGPITVPLVLSMGLGIGANIPGVIDGFGILALASVGPIITVLTVGLIVNRTAERELPAEAGEDADEL
ncbi:MAG: DUF1538 domain-containing protein [Verrucomicrobiota bacterium]